MTTTSIDTRKTSDQPNPTNGPMSTGQQTTKPRAPRTNKPQEKAPFQHISVEFLVKNGEVHATEFAAALEQAVRAGDWPGIIAMTGHHTSDATIQRRRRN